MSTSIVNNMMALNAQRQFGIVGLNKSKSTEILSSGYKINRAADDAAGLAISEKMRRQIRGLTQASANCQDGVSLCQVADGALNESQDILQRMNELAIKSANGTNSNEDRSYIQQEVEQLKEELDRIANNTTFNEGIYPLKGVDDGSINNASSVKLQFTDKYGQIRQVVLEEKTKTFTIECDADESVNVDGKSYKNGEKVEIAYIQRTVSDSSIDLSRNGETNMHWVGYGRRETGDGYIIYPRNWEINSLHMRDLKTNSDGYIYYDDTVEYPLFTFFHIMMRMKTQVLVGFKLIFEHQLCILATTFLMLMILLVFLE